MATRVLSTRAAASSTSDRAATLAPTTLTRARILILPSRYGYTYAAVVLLMFIGAINYGNSMAFVLTFLLVGLGGNGMWATWRNLSGLRIHPPEARPTFLGRQADLEVRLEETAGRDRFAVGVGQVGAQAHFTSVQAHGVAVGRLAIPARTRGRQPQGRVCVFTLYPLGLFRGWAFAPRGPDLLVYPKPAAGTPLPSGGGVGSGGGASQARGHDDFRGMHRYGHGDSPRHIAWKVYARRDELLTKEFCAATDPELWLDWDHVPANQDIERRLSVLCRWVLDAEARHLSYGLRIPGVVIPPGSGASHCDLCLRALALFDRPAREAQS